MSQYNVISLDGGGVRGVVTAVFLDEFQRRCPGYSDGIDLFAGSSIGAANALALSGRDRRPDAMVRFYRDHGHQLFSRPFPVPCDLSPFVDALAALPGVGPWVSELRQLLLPKWSPDGLRSALEEYFGASRTLADLLPAHVMITTLALSRRWNGLDMIAPVCMTNYGHEFLDLSLPAALLRSMSAPTYFPSTPDGYVDGGVFAANPSIAALGVAMREAGRDVSAIRMLSIGTGITADGIATGGRELAWGQLQWARAFPGVSSMAEIEFDHTHCATLLGPNYCRLNIELPGPVAMDDYRAIPGLEAEARRQLDGPEFQRALEFVETHFG